ncbi:MAG TPA: SDR family NAD(P)-dependent oxidoreductase [Solirubrobacteraceae bacterium]|nr:SDR family NAD(P)-dependent oxidoreductase [Solirubrobacteraceae bacterium]
MRIAGATVLLTGATGGIGHAIARAVAARGGQLILTGRRVETLDALAAELGARALAVDLSDRVQVDRLIDDAGAVDLLIANAALPASGGIETFTVEELDRALEVNLRAPIVLARALLPAMLARRNGHLLFMSSLSGKSATTGSAVYSATKFGLRGFAAGLRADLHASGVGVSTVFPGFIRDAGMFANSGVRLPPGVGTRSPDDVAHAVIEAIERNRAEVDVAPLSLRAGAAVAGLAPELAMSVARRLGSDAIAREFAAAQRDKR